MGKSKDKSIAVAIGLNLFLPGLGYGYMGKIVLGIFAFILMGSVSFLSSNSTTIGMTWLSLNAIMALDMIILHTKYKKDSTKQCPQCAESIQKEAKKCRYCGADL